jgi:hypothetical protein
MIGQARIVMTTWAQSNGLSFESDNGDGSGWRNENGMNWIEGTKMAMSNQTWKIMTYQGENMIRWYHFE